MTDREARLDALRDEAARRGADGATGTGYYDRPLLKPPVWTWEVPAYLFVGGVAGVAAMIASVSAVAGADDTLVRDARWIAAAGAVDLSGAAHLGSRPSRALHLHAAGLQVAQPDVGRGVDARALLACRAAAGRVDGARFRHRHELAVAGDGRSPMWSATDGPGARDLHRRAARALRRFRSGPRTRACCPCISAPRRSAPRCRRSSCAVTSRRR